MTHIHLLDRKLGIITIPSYRAYPSQLKKMGWSELKLGFVNHLEWTGNVIFYLVGREVQKKVFQEESKEGVCPMELIPNGKSKKFSFPNLITLIYILEGFIEALLVEQSEKKTNLGASVKRQTVKSEREVNMAEPNSARKHHESFLNGVEKNRIHESKDDKSHQVKKSHGKVSLFKDPLYSVHEIIHMPYNLMFLRP